MLKQLTICKKCINNLGIYGKMPLDLYVLICEFYSGDEPVLCFSESNGCGETLFHFLEKHKYIVTTEYDNEKLIVKPIGYKRKRSRYVESHTVCAFQQLHKKKARSE